MALHELTRSPPTARALATLLLVIWTSPLSAQCGGNGSTSDLTTTPLAIGRTVTVTVSGPPGARFLIYTSQAQATFTFPGFGTACLDILHPTFRQTAAGFLPASGAALFPIVVPNVPAIATLPPTFAQGLVFDGGAPGGLGITQAHRIDFEVADGYLALPPLAEPRVFATGSLLGDGRVLVTGGGAGSLFLPVPSSTCDLFDPLTRTVLATNPMANLRALHTATTLDDGRILIVGGVTDLLGTVTATCEIFDPQSLTWTATAPMSFPRSGHTATRLQDGRILVAGGTSTYTGTLGTILTSSRNDGEIYDPTTGAWSNVGNTMFSRRFVHAATRLQDGRVLLASGINGVMSFFGLEIPTLTSSCTFFDPAIDTFVNAPSLSGAVTGHRMTTMPSGDVWLTGGATSSFLGAPSATDATRLFAAGSWGPAPNLPTAAALHGQVLLQDGSVHILGGLTGDLNATSATDNAGRFNGSSVTPRNMLPFAVGAQVCVLLESGAIFVAGGADANGIGVDTCYLYTPD